MAQMVKNLLAMQEIRFNPWVRKIPWRREWQTHSSILAWKIPGQRSQVGYNPQSHKKLDKTEWSMLSLFTSGHIHQNAGA